MTTVGYVPHLVAFGDNDGFDQQRGGTICFR